MGEAKDTQIRAEMAGNVDYPFPDIGEDFPWDDGAECTPDHPCIDCQWANKREAEREQ